MKFAACMAFSFLFLSFRHVLNVICSFLCNSPSSEFSDVEELPKKEQITWLFLSSHFFMFFWFHFFTIVYMVYVLYTFVEFCKLCILSVMLMYSYYVFVFSLLCMFYSVYSVLLCCSMYCLCVNVYCTPATGCQPNCS